MAYESLQREREALRIHEDDRGSFVYEPAVSGSWREQTVTGKFWDGAQTQTLSMVPMGGTILRKVTFPLAADKRA